MRSATLGLREGLSRRFGSGQTVRMLRKALVCRAFELKTAEVYKTGVMKLPIYLSLGEEYIPVALSEAFPNCMIFAQHRAHSTYLAFGGQMDALIDELLHLPTGCCGGMAGSAAIQDRAIRMVGHSGLMGDQVPIAVGAALASRERVLTLFGDAAGEEDYIASAMGYAASKHLPLLFVCEDNNLSILTKVEVRRSWSLVDLARAFGMPAVDITDDPWLIADEVQALAARLPAFVNVRTCRHLWHAGVGSDGEPEWDRHALVLEEVARLGLAEKAATLEKEAQDLVKEAWHKGLLRRKEFDARQASSR